MFRPTVAIITFITDLRGSHISGWGYYKEISFINFCYLNVWCGYCIQYNNYSTPPLVIVTL